MNEVEFKEMRLCYIALAILCTIALIVSSYIAPTAVPIFMAFTAFLWGIIAGFIVLNESGLIKFEEETV